MGSPSEPTIKEERWGKSPVKSLADGSAKWVLEGNQRGTTKAAIRAVMHRGGQGMGWGWAGRESNKSPCGKAIRRNGRSGGGG